MEHLTQRYIFVLEGHVGVLDEQSGLVIHHAGQPNPHRLDLSGVDLPHLAQPPGHTHQLRAELLRRQLPGYRGGHLVVDVSQLVDQAGHQVGAAHIDSNIIHQFALPSICSANS